MKKSLSLLLLLFTSCTFAHVTSLKTKTWECYISDKGNLEKIVFKNNQKNDTIPFFSDKGQAGPSFYANYKGKEISPSWIPDGNLSYKSIIDKVECRMTYLSWKGQPALEITLENKGTFPFQPEKAGLKLGIDTYMDKYPEWFGKFFPTLMRNEKSHFYGYMQSPSGKMLGIVSPNPIASWSVEYNLGYQDPAPYWFMGHRIESLNIDLLNTLPLPEHNPQDLWCLSSGECKKWIIAFVDIISSSQFEEKVSQLVEAPVIRMSQTNFVSGDKVEFDVLSSFVKVYIKDDEGNDIPVKVEHLRNNVNRVTCTLPNVGLYYIKALSGNKQSEGIISAHASWNWIMEKAREGTFKHAQKATSHIESWYGFHSAFLAAKYFPDKSLDDVLNQRFEYLFDLLHDKKSMRPKFYASRIQNTSGTIGMLTDRYEAYGNIEDLKRASRLADWLIESWQREDGAYMNHGTVYTSVIYVAKSILELTIAERNASKEDIMWHDIAERHYQSAKKAIDQLVASQGNFETEGEMTFEDGMISCSALQIGLLGLMQKDLTLRKFYTNAMLQILNSHDCLTQLRVPDARRRGGTMRYWEAQYDVQMLPNMFNSPHGWSAWRGYATYYAYLLTGDERWIVETYNAMGAFANLIDYRNGKLRWAFVVDPYLKVKQACSIDSHFTADSLSFGNPHPELYDTREFTIGEQYVDMISGWQTVNTQDNDVHEVFKCIGESMLTNAFVIERENGEFVGYNCNVVRKGDVIIVKANESQITNIHCNLKKTTRVSFNGKTKVLEKGFMGWAFGKDIYID